MSINIIELESCGSTSTELAAMEDAPEGTVISTRNQTTGRGQRGNTWEAEPGKNLTFSQLLRPHRWPAARQFELSMLVALAIADTLDNTLAANGSTLRTKVKWPNDIYAGDGKICGILIENRLCGNIIERTIAGIGIDVNQEKFVSDAPNPVSLIQLTGKKSDLKQLLSDVCTAIDTAIREYTSKPDAENLLCRFKSRLYRGDGKEYLFREPGGEPFQASIIDISQQGYLTLSNGRSYAFKEIAYII